MATEAIEWMSKARCRDAAPETFFPNDGAGVARARRVCANCDVAQDCLLYALDHGLEHGVWGGKSERERRRLRKVLRTERALPGFAVAS